MPLTRRSKIKEVLRHPIGQHLLQNALWQMGKTEKWLANPLVANASLQTMDRLAGAGFCSFVLEMAANQPDYVQEKAPQKPQWWKESVIYHIYLPSFMDSDQDGFGDMGGVLARFPYLESLGVNVLWLWPTHKEKGCQGLCAFANLPCKQQFSKLLAKAHACGMRVVVGLNIASTTSRHPWFLNPNKRQSHYILQPGGKDAPPNNWLRGQEAVWGWYKSANAWVLQLAGKGQADLNWDNPELRKDVAALLKTWVKAGVDGFFFDTIQHLSKSGFEDGNTATAGFAAALGYEKTTFGPRLHRYLRQLRENLPNHVFLAAELPGTGTELAKLFCGPTRQELDLIFCPQHLAPKARPQQGEEARLELLELKQYYIKWMRDYGAENWMSLFLENSKMPRVVSRVGASPLYRAIVAKMLATMLFTLRGTPVLYQGQELGLANTSFAAAEELHYSGAQKLYAELCEKEDAQKAFESVLALTADHARTPMPWSCAHGAGFTGAQPWMRLCDGADYLNANSQMEDENSVWHFHKNIIALRKESPCLVYGSFNPVFEKSSKVFCYFRILDGEKYYVEINLTEGQVLRPGRILPTQKLKLSNYESQAKQLRAYEANIYSCQ